MSFPDPAGALTGERTGNICDRCNRGLQTWDVARIYATYDKETGWTLRRFYCLECGSSSIESGTKGADEVVADAVFWNHRLAGVRISDRSPPEDGNSE